MGQPASSSQDYPKPSVTADIVVWAVRQGQPHLLLIQRRHWPYAGQWALPGGFMDITETIEEAARRELTEETGLVGVPLEPLHPFDAPGRDPRKRVITMAYVALLAGWDGDMSTQAGDDAADARWWPVADLPPLAFDHDQILAAARSHLKRRLLAEDLGHRLLPETFTAQDLGDAFTPVLGQPLSAERVVQLLQAAGVIESAGPDRYRYRASASGDAWPQL